MAQVFDVPARFRAIPRKLPRRRYLGARNLLIAHPYYKLRWKFNGIIPKPVPEHFQGVQRVGQRLIISGGLADDPTSSQLIVLRMRTRRHRGPWAVPDYPFSYRDPPVLDATSRIVDISKELWHGGGIQALEGIVAIPIYGSDEERGGEVRFFDFRNEWKTPRELDDIRIRKGKLSPAEKAALSRSGSEPDVMMNHMLAKAVGMAYYKPTRQYVLVIWDDERLDFHVSAPDADLVRDGFPNLWASQLSTRRLPGEFKPRGATYQSVNLVSERGGAMYMVATRNTSIASPGIAGKDLIDLYSVKWRDHDLSAPPKIASVIGPQQMWCKHKQCNFGGAAGIYIDDEFHMYLYSAYHFLNEHRGAWRVSFNEYGY